jgi:hypothetical protein
MPSIVPVMYIEHWPAFGRLQMSNSAWAVKKEGMSGTGDAACAINSPIAVRPLKII